MPGHGSAGDGKGPGPIWFGCGTEAPPGIRPVRNRTGEGRKETVCPDCGQLRYCRGLVLGRWQKHLLQCMSMSGDTERGRICTPPCGCTCRFVLVRFEVTAAITVVKYGDCRWCGPLPCGKGSRVRSRSFSVRQNVICFCCVSLLRLRQGREPGKPWAFISRSPVSLACYSGARTCGERLFGSAATGICSLLCRLVSVRISSLWQCI